MLIPVTGVTLDFAHSKWLSHPVFIPIAELHGPGVEAEVGHLTNTAAQ